MCAGQKPLEEQLARLGVEYSWGDAYRRLQDSLMKPDPPPSDYIHTHKRQRMLMSPSAQEGRGGACTAEAEARALALAMAGDFAAKPMQASARGPATVGNTPLAGTIVLTEMVMHLLATLYEANQDGLLQPRGGIQPPLSPE